MKPPVRCVGQRRWQQGVRKLCTALSQHFPNAIKREDVHASQHLRHCKIWTTLPAKRRQPARRHLIGEVTVRQRGSMRMVSFVAHSSLSQRRLKRPVLLLASAVGADCFSITAPLRAA